MNIADCGSESFDEKSKEWDFRPRADPANSAEFARVSTPSKRLKLQSFALVFSLTITI
jgi:hypothetical protein